MGVLEPCKATDSAEDAALFRGEWQCSKSCFRNRLSPATQKQLEVVLQVSYLRLCGPDVDATVQEANMAYPSDAQLRKLARKGAKVLTFCKKMVPDERAARPRAGADRYAKRRSTSRIPVPR